VSNRLIPLPSDVLPPGVEPADASGQVAAAAACLIWHPDRAGPLSARALQAALAGSDAAVVADARLVAASHLMHVGQSDAGRDQLQQAAVWIERSGDARQRWQLEFGWARLRRVQSQASQVLAQVDRLVGTLGPANHPADRVRALSLRADALRLMDRYDEALEAYFEALHAARQAQLAGLEANSLNNAGGMLLDMFDEDDAEPLLEEGLAMARRLGSAFLSDLLSLNLLVCLSGQGRLDRLWALVEQQLLPRQDEIRCDPMLLHSVLARACLQTGRLDQAEQQLDLASRRRDGRAGLNGDSSLQWAWVSAQVHLARGRPDLALTSCADKVNLLGQQGPADAGAYDAWQVLRAASQAHKALGRTDEALGCLERAQTLRESLVGRSVHARQLVVQVRRRADEATADRDRALQAEAQARQEQHRLKALNERLQAQIAENDRLQRTLREMSLVDELTGLHNRRHLRESAPALIESAHRKGQPLALALLDLDHFKRVNDSYGHAMGDAVLRRLADALRQGLRSTDLACRWGGEEFVLLLPDAGAGDAQHRLQVLLRDWMRLVVEQEGRQLSGLAFSGGVAGLAPAEGFDNLLHRADQALYAAKAGGRARILVWQDAMAG